MNVFDAGDKDTAKKARRSSSSKKRKLSMNDEELDIIPKQIYGDHSDDVGLAPVIPPSHPSSQLLMSYVESSSDDE